MLRTAASGAQCLKSPLAMHPIYPLRVYSKHELHLRDFLVWGQGFAAGLGIGLIVSFIKCGI